MKSIVITHFPSATGQYHEDMNEIFCGKTTDEIDISSGVGGDDNEIKIKLTLERIVSRIDIKFIKVASDDDHIEVPYATGNIFGGTGTTSLTSLIFTSSNVPLKYNLNGENPDYVTGVQCQVTYAAPSFQYGEANADAVKALDYQPFPKNADAINNNMETNIKRYSQGRSLLHGIVLTSISLIIANTECQHSTQQG